MKLRSTATMIILSSAFITTSHAAENCKDPQTQTAMNICADKDFQRADAELNKNYKTLVSKIDTKDKATLKKVQLAWIKFKELQCNYSASQYEGGTMQPLIYSTCLTGLTEQRTKEIKAMIEEASL